MQRLPIRRGALVVAVVLLVALAGCSGPSSSPTPTPPDAATATDGFGPDGPPSPTPGEASPTSEPDNVDRSVETNVSGADLDGPAVNSATIAAAETAGSYTLRSSTDTVVTSQQRGRVVQRVNTTTRVDLAAERGLRRSNRTVVNPQTSRNPSAAVYTANDTSYRRIDGSRGVTYASQTGAASGPGGIVPVNVSGLSQNNTFLFDGLVWEANGTTTVDGVTATQYTLAGIENASSFSEGSPATVTDIDGTLAITDDVLRRANLTVTSRTATSTSTLRLEFALTELGSTTVPEPDWLAQASES